MTYSYMPNVLLKGHQFFHIRDVFFIKNHILQLNLDIFTESITHKKKKLFKKKFRHIWVKININNTGSILW